MPTLLITGADGFIGQQLCALALQRGYAVRGAVRRLNAAGLPRGIQGVNLCAKLWYHRHNLAGSQHTGWRGSR
jgi:uncharacterized protein YbjT (DUF2867 family)